ncbi:hypothetical protein AAHE18_09G117900 [Arachis hypogaea]|nr:Seed trypsin/chymotrypsin inhibitor [Arachis hypogaea]
MLIKVVVLLFHVGFSSTAIASDPQFKEQGLITTKKMFNNDDASSHDYFVRSPSDKDCCKNCFHHQDYFFGYYQCLDGGESCYESCKICICNRSSPRRCYCADLSPDICPIPECN